MGSVRVKKKKTRTLKRRKEANTKVVLAATAAVVQGFMQETQKNISVTSTENTRQVDRVWRWSNECLDTLLLGKHAVKAATSMLCKVDEAVQDVAPPGEDKTVGHYAIVWTMIGFLLDEAKRLAPESDRRSWNYLASVVNTWAARVLDASPADGTDYELQAGQLADRAWQIVFDKPRDYFG